MALAAVVFVVMFLAGAMSALREELRDAPPNAAKASSIVEGTPVGRPAASPASLSMSPTSVALLEPPTTRAAAPATSAAEPVASASAEPVAAGEPIRVMMRSSVAGARFYRNGKQVGMNSVVVELAPGEKRAFEVALPGRVSRKVVVDGSRTELVVFLPRIPETPAAPTATPTPSAQDEPVPPAPH